MMAFMLIHDLSFSKEMSVAFFDLKGTGISAEKSKELSDRFLTELYKTKGFKIITTKELWDLLQKEGVQKASKFEDFDVNERSINSLEESNLLKFLAHTSMLLNIEAIIMGTLSMTDSNLYISIKLIKANDGQVILMANKEFNPSNKDSLNQALMIVANEIAEPTGVLIYKEQMVQNDIGNISTIIKGYGSKNKDDLFVYDTCKGVWKFDAEFKNDTNPFKINIFKWNIEYVNNEKKNEFITKCYDKNNNLLVSLNFKHVLSETVLDGQIHIYFPNGSMSFSGTYKSGNLDNGVWFNKDGDTTATFNNDIGKYKNMSIYNTDTAYALSKICYGKIMFIDADTTNKFDYKRKCYCYAISLKNEYGFFMNKYESFRDIILHGLFTSFFPNGAKKDSGLVIYDKMNGKWIERYNNGKISKITNWKNGIEDGEQTFLWENGNKRLKYFVKNGNKHGIEESYHENGNREAVIYRKNGEIEKPYYIYRADGAKEFYMSIYNGLQNGIDSCFHSIFSEWSGGIQALYYWKNNEQYMTRNFYIKNDFSKCDEHICRYLNNINDTIFTNLRIKYQNGKYSKYKIDLKSREENLIDDNDTLNKEDFKILMKAIEYKKANLNNINRKK
jgi:antitoxin component YwqK of YwqJK toxin-antitoxin module